MFDLGQRGIRVGFVDEGIEFLHSFPNGHAGSGFELEIIAGFQIVGDSLLLVLLAIEVLYSVAGCFVLSELSLVFLGVKLGFLVHGFLGSLSFDLVLEDVDGVDVVGKGLERETISVAVDGFDG